MNRSTIKLVLHHRTFISSVRFVQRKYPVDPEAHKNIDVQNYSIKHRRNRVYVWGMTLSGQLGHDKLVRPNIPNVKPRESQSKPYKTKFADFHKVRDVAAGCQFSIFVATPENASNISYKVFGCGLNSDSQLGYQAARKGHPMEILTEPVPILFPLKSDTVVQNAAAGRSHTVIVTDKEGVWSVGSNCYGQCGRRIVENENYFGSSKINKMKGISNTIIRAVCGLDHTLLVTDKGEVWACGLGTDGQTGLENFECTGEPKQCRGDIRGEKIVQVSSRGDTVLAINNKGDVFGWGNSEYSQLSAATDAPQLHTPTRLDLGLGPIKHVAAAGSMCAVVTAAGEVYTWGFGMLGQGPNATHSAKPQLIPPTLFGRNELNADTTVEAVYAGMFDFAAITNDKAVYSWGRNHRGQLGLGHKNFQPFPSRVAVGALVSKVACGEDHMIALGKALV